MNPLPDQELADIDHHFADFIERFGGNGRLMRLAATSLSRSIRDGNICMSLAAPPAKAIGIDKTGPSEWPEVNDWRSAFRDSKAVGPPEADTPLVLDSSNRLYLRRYWNYQERLGKALRERAARNKSIKRDRAGTREGAIGAAVENYLTIISGGPGTGKTTAVLDMLIRLLEMANHQPLRVALVAPTGKAAVRLEETIRNRLQELECSDEIKARIPATASTIHRLLGRKGNSVYFRHDQRNPLPVDLLVIDEASMVALALLCALFDAVQPAGRVLLLGDHGQLASVEAGAVLADIVEAAASIESPLAHAAVTLEKNYRFREESGVHQLSEAVRRG